MSELLTSTGIHLPSTDETLRIADDRIEVRPKVGSVIADGELLDGVTGIKFGILAFLASKPDHAVPQSDLCMSVWGNDSEAIRGRARVHMMRLRYELGAELGDPEYGAVRTRYGLGYQAVKSLSAHSIVLPSEEKSTSYLIADERIAVNTDAFTVRSDGRLLNEITRFEFDLLAALARKPDVTVALHDLLSAVWGGADKATHASARVTLSNLRKKLGPELGDLRAGAIRTRQQVGYYAVRSL